MSKFKSRHEEEVSHWVLKSKLILSISKNCLKNDFFGEFRREQHTRFLGFIFMVKVALFFATLIRTCFDFQREMILTLVPLF